MLRANPASIQFVALGEALRSRGRHAEAVDVLRRGLKRHPNLRSAQAVLVRVYAQANDRVSALALLGQLVLDDPTNSALACLQIELLLADDQLSKAGQALSRLEASVPNEPALGRLRAKQTATRRAR